MSIDARQRTLHLLPVLQIDPFDRVAPDAISLSVSVDWHDAPPTPVGGWVICQPYPNRHYFVGGSGNCQLGHFISLLDGQQAGDVSFHWTVVVPGRPPGHCQVTHRLALAFETGVGRMYSMDVANWWSQSEFASQARATPELGRNRFSRLTPGGISPTRQARVSESIRQGCRYLDIQECLTLPAITLNDCWTLETYGGDNALSCLEALQ